MRMPPLIRFLLKWTAIGTGAGWLFLGALLVFDVGELGSMMVRSSSPFIALVILGLSFAVTFSQITVLTAVLLRSDFGGTPPRDSSRLERWKAGHSAELPDDKPLPMTPAHASRPDAE